MNIALILMAILAYRITDLRHIRTNQSRKTPVNLIWMNGLVQLDFIRKKNGLMNLSKTLKILITVRGTAHTAKMGWKNTGIVRRITLSIWGAIASLTCCCYVHDCTMVSVMREEDREAYKQQFPMHNLTIIGNTVRLYIEHTQWYFRFDEYGGKEGAIAAAQAKRDSFPASKIHTLYDTDKVRPMGITGIRGVQLYHNSKNGEWLGYLAKWQEGKPGNGRRKQRSKYFRFDSCADPLQAAIDYREMQIEKNSMSEHNPGYQWRAEGTSIG